MKILHIDYSDFYPKLKDYLVTHIYIETQDCNVDGSSYGYLTLITSEGTIYATHLWPVATAPAKYTEGQNLEGVCLIAMSPDNF